MQSGDTFTDEDGSDWVVDAALGRGTWGRCYALRGDGGRIAVLKVPLLPSDFPEADDASTLAAACAATSSAQLRLLQDRKLAFLPELLSVARLDDGRTGMVIPRYSNSLEDRLVAGAPLSSVLDTLITALHKLVTAATAGSVHGNLRPGNLFVDDDQVVITDPLVDVMRPHRQALEAQVLARATYHPPEAAFHPTGMWDTWSISAMLFRACRAPTSADDPRRGPVVDLPHAGLDKVELAAVRDGAAARLRSESANPRFAGRVTGKLGSVLNRGLSAQVDPSPPYRFLNASELLRRLVEVDELVHPCIDTVSRIMLGSGARDGTFQGGDEVRFSANVGTTTGVTGHEDLAVGVNLQDLDAPGDGRVRLTDSRFDVDRYPSGRWRFDFFLPDVAPGRYQVRIAFAVKGSEEAPKTADVEFEVRPRPGYVPPPAPPDSPPPPIQLSKAREGQPPIAQLEAIPSEATAEAPEDEFESPDTVVSDPGTTPPVIPLHRPVAAPVAPAPTPAPPATAAPAPPSQPSTPSGPSVFVPPPPATAAVEASTNSVPSVPPLPDLPDPALHDYPFPTEVGSDLPDYEGADRPSDTLEALRDRVLGAFGGDPMTAGMAVMASGFILLVLLITLVRSC